MYRSCLPLLALLVACSDPAPMASAADPGVRSRAPDGTPDLRVDCTGGTPYRTIQSAIDAAVTGDWISVRPCTYEEQIDFRGKSLWISSTGGPAVTIIDAQNNGTAVTATKGEGDGTALVGFTIEDGDDPAVDVAWSALRLEDVVFDDCKGDVVIESEAGDLELHQVVLDQRNEVTDVMVHADKGSLVMTESTVDCSSDWGLQLGHGTFFIDRSDIRCWSEAGNRSIDMEHVTGRLQRSTVRGDIHVLTEDDHYDDLVHLENTFVDGSIGVRYGTFRFRNSILLGGQIGLRDTEDTVLIENSVFVGEDCFVDSSAAERPQFENSDFWGAPAVCNGPNPVGDDGNFSADPMFADLAARDLRPAPGSPLIDSGRSAEEYNDLDGTRNDLGIFGGPLSREVPPPARHWIVNAGLGGDFNTIQAAIDAAGSGDSIEVRAGTYSERIDFSGKTLDIFSTEGSATTTIRGDGSGTVVKVERGESNGTRLRGFTISNGQDDDDGSAIEVHTSVIELEDLVLTGNRNSFSVLYAADGWVDVKDVRIEGNTIHEDGQAIWSDGGGFTATNLTARCDGGAQALWHHNTLILTDSMLRCPNGIGIHDYHGEDSIHRTIVVGGDYGIAAYDQPDLPPEAPDNPNERLILSNSIAIGDVALRVAYMHAILTNNLLLGEQSALHMTGMHPDSEAYSTIFQGADCGIRGDQPFTEAANGFWNNVSDGCGVAVSPRVTANPQYANLPYDATLAPTSPYIDEGRAGVEYRDADGTRNDIGPYGGPAPLQ